MTTVSKSFTAAGVSSSLVVDAVGETVSLDVSGTYVGSVQLERATTSSEQAWERVLGPFAVDNATVAKSYVTKRHGEHFRVRCTSYTSGTIVTSIADGDKTVKVERDSDGNVLETITQAGRTIEGDVTVTGNAVVDGSFTRAPVVCSASTLTVTAALHAGRTVVLDRAAGIAVTLPDATGTGDEYEFFVKTTFTGAASIKSSRSADIMIGHARMGNNTDNSTVDWQATAADTFDTIDLLGTSNSTGGIEGQTIRLRDVAANTWAVEIAGDAAGTEATPFANTVS